VHLKLIHALPRVWRGLTAVLRGRARVDGETGLPNLVALAALPEARRGAIVVARIDRFATIAAALGPAATIDLIHRIADRLGVGLDRPVYRIDAALLCWVETGDDRGTLEQKLEGLSALMRSPVDCGRLVDVRLAFGIAAPDGASGRQQAADAALAAERAARRGSRFEWFANGAGEETGGQRSLLDELDAALANGEIWNAYQPKLDIASGRIVGVETLVRWDHRVRGQISPGQFIPLVEANGRAHDLAFNVLVRALADAVAWRIAGLDLSVAINISANLLLDAGFAVLLDREITAALQPPERITLEITESAAMTGNARAIAALESWRALGVTISIDDCGAGLSSLGYLQALPATELKIDRHFVTSVATDPGNARIVRSIIARARELGMKVVAEGVEDADCLAALAGMGCDTAQGWLIGRPMTMTAIITLLEDQETAAA
jgi:EAL domain-containing protein (putative c-di-GMP-specific phosphodiesterase class I)